MNKGLEREKKLLELLQLNQQMDVKEVCQELSVSEATVRRLFQDLADQGKLIRIHGGVQLAPTKTFDYSYQQAVLRNNEQKALISKYASQFIEDNDKLFLDSGTTVMKLAESLALKLEMGSLRNLLVITNSFTIVEILSRHCKVILTGGEPRIERRDVCGTVAEDILKRFHVDKAFFGADTVHPKHGLMTTDERTAKMNEIVIENSDKVYVLADHEKFNKKSFISYASFNDIDLLLTDAEISSPILKLFKDVKTSIKVI